MILHRWEIEKIQIINIQQLLRLKDTAKLALEFAVKKSKTKTELIECAKYAEWEIDDRNWAEEIRKKAYGENWNSSNNENSNTTNTGVSINNFDSFMKENESDLIKYFSSRQPAAYKNFIKEESEKQIIWKELKIYCRKGIDLIVFMSKKALKVPCKWWVLCDSNTWPLRYERRALTNWAKDPLIVGRNYSQNFLILFFYLLF